MMTGKDGRISFTKCVIVNFLAMAWWDKAPALLWTTAILAASFGAKVFLAWLSRLQATASDVNETKTAIERRVIDKDIGIEPAP